MIVADELRSAAERTAREIGHGSNPYFEALADGRMSRAAFVAGQHRFLSAVEFFSRPMLALAARLDDADARASILANAWEEHGEGDPDRRHGASFRELLRRLGAPEDQIGRLSPWHCIEDFNATLMRVCTKEAPAHGLAALGMIEWMFADISAWIGQAIVARAWLPADRLIHYDLHAAIDRGHADGFWALIDWRSQQADARPGLVLGAGSFDRLYRGLLDEQARSAADR